MSSRRRSGGFTLLELQVAILVLVLTVLGLMHLLASHERLVRSMEDVASGDRTLYIVPPAGPFDALVGVPASLGETPPVPLPLEPEFDYTVTVQSVARELDPPRALATVTVQEVKKKKNGKDKDEDEKKEKGKK